VDTRHAAADEVGASASSESWADITAARQKLMELEDINHRLKEDLTKRVLSSVFGVQLIVFASFVLWRFRDDQPSIAMAVMCLGLFVAGTGISQLLTALWAFKTSKQLRNRLLEAVSEASKAYGHDFSIAKRG
jgi:hypothetical protein